MTAQPDAFGGTSLDLEEAALNMLRVSREHGGCVLRTLPDGRQVHGCECGAEFTDIDGCDGDDQWQIHCHVEELKAGLATLRASSSAGERGSAERPREFIRKVVLCALDGNDAYGGDIQDWAVAAGILAPHKVSEPCGEVCNCADADNIPGTCYRLTPEYARTSSAARDEGKQAGG